MSVPWEHLYNYPHDHNVMLHESLVPPQYEGLISERYLPVGQPIWAVGEVRKRQGRLQLVPNGKAGARSLYLSTYEPRDLASLVQQEKSAATIGTAILLGAGVLLVGGGVYLRPSRSNGSSGGSSSTSSSKNGERGNE